MLVLQGKSERIKNFPYPRKFATLNHFFMSIFVLRLPLALVPQFGEMGIAIIEKNPLAGKLFVWLAAPPIYDYSLSFPYYGMYWKNRRESI